MRLRERFVFLAGLVLVLVAGAGGALLGMWLGETASAPEERRVTIVDPDSSLSAVDALARSTGGFTGFGGRPALLGEVLRTGEVKATSPGTIELASTESRATVRYTTPERLFRIVPLTTPLRPGDLVQLRVQDGAVTGALRLPTGLEEGINRGP
jgi:hypothetical protein